MKDVDRCMFYVGFCRINVLKSLKFQRLCDIINLQFRDLQFSCIKETKRERQNCKFTVPPGESPHRSPSPTRKKRAAYASSLILTILKFQCFAAYIRNSLISRSISSADLQKQHRVLLRPCTFRELCHGWRPD